MARMLRELLPRTCVNLFERLRYISMRETITFQVQSHAIVEKEEEDRSVQRQGTVRVIFKFHSFVRLRYRIEQRYE